MCVSLSPGTVSPLQRPLLQCVCRKKFLKCLFISLLIYSCIISAATCWYRKSDDFNTGCVRIHSFIPTSLFLIFYVVYLMECWRNAPIFHPMMSKSLFTQHVYLLRHAAPVIWWRVVCYHFVRRSRQIVRYRNGNPITTTQIYYERTNSHVDEQDFDYVSGGVRDVSHDVIDLEKHPLVVVNFSKCFSFSNLASENEYLGQRCDFFRSNETWDNYLEAKEGMKLRNVDWKDHFIVCEDPKNPPIYATYHFYWLCSMFLGSWFLRVFLERKTAVINYQVEKLFGDATVASNDQPWHSLARVATMDSTEMEWQIQTNQIIAPSYGDVANERESNQQEQAVSINRSIAPVVLRRHRTEGSGADARRVSLQRTRSWIRDGRGLMTSLRRSMTQLFSRQISHDGDDVTLLSPLSPRPSPCGQSLSEAPPTYSEAMNLHKILGFYDENGLEKDVTKSECSISRTCDAPIRRSSSRSKFTRRKRPNQLRVRSQYNPGLGEGGSTIYSSGDPQTGPAAMSEPVVENSLVEVVPVVEGRDSGARPKEHAFPNRARDVNTTGQNGQRLDHVTRTGPSRNYVEIGEDGTKDTHQEFASPNSQYGAIGGHTDTPT